MNWRGANHATALEVLEPFTGRTLRSAKTGEDGAFDFSGLPPGIYILRVNADGHIPVAIHPDASLPDLFLSVSTDCGLMFRDPRTCAQPRFEVESLKGTITDAPPGNAELLLSTSSGKLIHRIVPDSKNRFEFAGLEPGSYELLVQSSQTTPLRASVTIRAGARTSAIDISLLLRPHCSEARLH